MLCSQMKPAAQKLLAAAGALLLAACGRSTAPIVAPIAPIVAAASSPTSAVETSSRSFLSQDEIKLAARSQVIKSLDLSGGCGAAPAAGRMLVDGHANDWHARPTGIAGTHRYDGGEWVWTEYPFDDGGDGAFQYPGEATPIIAEEATAGVAGELLQRYGSNAADISRGTLDPLAPISMNHRLRDAALAAGLDVRYTEYLLGSHCFDLAQGAYPYTNADAPAFNGTFDIRDLSVAYTGAWWVSGLRLRPEIELLGTSRAAPGGADESALGIINAVSHALPDLQITLGDCTTAIPVGVAGLANGSPESEPDPDTHALPVPAPATWRRGFSFTGTQRAEY